MGSRGDSGSGGGAGDSTDGSLAGTPSTVDADWPQANRSSSGRGAVTGETAEAGVDWSDGSGSRCSNGAGAEKVSGSGGGATTGSGGGVGAMRGADG